MPIGPFGIDPVIWAVLRLVIALALAVFVLLNGALAQTFETASRRRYVVSFSLAGNPFCTQGVKTLVVQVAGVKRNFSFDTTGRTGSTMGWQSETVPFTATRDRTMLRFTSTTDPNSQCGPEIDNVKVVAAEE